MSTNDSPDDDNGSGLLDFLSTSYRTLQDRWVEELAEQNIAPGAPWSHLLDVKLDDDKPITSAETLMWNAEEAAVIAGQSVGHHLGLLARSYWRDPLYPEGSPVSSRWPYTAVFACGRAIAEGTAMMRWILDPNTNRSERTRRAAVLLLWSDANYWEPVVEDTGLTVSREERADGSVGPPFVKIDDRSKPLSLFQMIRLGHGRRGTGVYGRWSPLVHHSPRETVRRSRYRLELGQGRFVSTQIREDEHLELLNQLAEYVAEAAIQQGLYFGRDASPVADITAEVRFHVSEALPSVSEQVRIREESLPNWS